MQRQNWTDNGHVKVDWSRVRVGDVVDHVTVEVKACPVKFGDPHWSVLVVEPNSESATVERLYDASIRTYWPKVYKWMPTKDLLANGQKRMTKVPRSMFPGYLFADLRPGLDDFRAPLAIKGVRDYLWADDKPCAIPNALCDAIMERERGFATAKRPSPFSVGQTVRVIDGPFRYFLAKVESMDDRGRVEVLMDIFARPTPTRLDVTQLEKA